MARLEVQWLPAVGAARYEVREQGPGGTPVERFRNGIPLGPRVDSTRFVFTGAELRDYKISVRAYNRSGVASPEPSELTVSTNLRVEGSRVPTDIDLLMYISWDEHTDQNGDILEPTLRKGALLADPDQAPVGSAERRRRLRWDQGRTGNAMLLEANAGPALTLNGFSQTLATGEKSGPCNHHVKFGDSDDFSVAGRKRLFFSNNFAIVDRRTDASVNGQTEMDLTDNVTFIQWINPTLMWIRGDTFDDGAGQSYGLWCRAGQIGTKVIGWMWVLGGPPFFSGGHATMQQNPGVNGFSFVYVPTGDDSLFGAGKGYGLFWSHPWEQDKDSSDGGDGYPIDAGEYCGWLFCALTISPADAAGNCQFTQWVGQADQDNLQKLSTQTGPVPSTAQWSTTPDTGQDAPSIMTSVNQIEAQMHTDDSRYEDNASGGGHFANYDESRIYARTLSDAEIRGLYDHPGGQKRTENLIEPLRQVLTP